jgi:hypothetical protein
VNSMIWTLKDAYAIITKCGRHQVQPQTMLAYNVVSSYKKYQKKIKTCKYLIKCTRHVSGITFIGYVGHYLLKEYLFSIPQRCTL